MLVRLQTYMHQRKLKSINLKITCTYTKAEWQSGPLGTISIMRQYAQTKTYCELQRRYNPAKPDRRRWASGSRVSYIRASRRPTEQSSSTGREPGGRWLSRILVMNFMNGLFICWNFMWIIFTADKLSLVKKRGLSTNTEQVLK